MYEYFDVEHARMRLNNSIIRYKDVPIYVLGVNRGRNGGYSIEFFKLDDPNQKHKVVKLNEDFNLKPLPLGNVNIEAYSSYVYRKPSRTWKQGLSKENAFYRTYEKKGEHHFNINERKIITLVNGDYVPFKNAVKEVSNQKLYSCCFSRTFSISFGRVLQLVYKGRVSIGTVNRDCVNWKLNDEFFFLRETLMESIGA